MNNYSKLQKTIWSSSVIFLIIFSFTTVYIYQDHSFDKLQALPLRTNLLEQNNPQLKIGIIGDSWVAGEKLDKAIYDELKFHQQKVKVVSYEHPGAKTRQIYRDLISAQSAPFSGNKLLDQELNYIIVIAGVNDTAGHIGKQYYAHHMLLIIDTIISSGATPVILEIPEYSIEEVATTSFLSLSKRAIYQVLFDKMQTNVIDSYRKKLRDSIPPSTQDKIILIPFDGFIKDYSKSLHLYANPSHLNPLGWEQLGIYIAKQIAVHNSQNNNLML